MNIIIEIIGTIVTIGVIGFQMWMIKELSTMQVVILKHLVDMKTKQLATKKEVDELKEYKKKQEKVLVYGNPN